MNTNQLRDLLTRLVEELTINQVGDILQSNHLAIVNLSTHSDIWYCRLLSKDNKEHAGTGITPEEAFNDAIGTFRLYTTQRKHTDDL